MDMYLFINVYIRIYLGQADTLIDLHLVRWSPIQKRLNSYCLAYEIYEIRFNKTKQRIL